MASNPPYTPNLDAAPTRNRRPFRARYPIWTPRQPVRGVQSALDPKSGRHANHPLAPNPPYTPNLDATPTPDRRPNRPPPKIWTPPQPVSGVQSALHLQSGRHADTQQASKSATTKNLDAAPARKWRPPTNPRTRQSLKCHHLNRQSLKCHHLNRQPIKFEYQTRQFPKCQCLNHQKPVFK